MNNEQKQQKLISLYVEQLAVLNNEKLMLMVELENKNNEVELLREELSRRETDK